MQYSVCIHQPRRSDLHGKGEAAGPAGLSGRAAETGLMAVSMGSHCEERYGGTRKAYFYGLCLSFSYKGALIQKYLLAVPSSI